MVSQPGQGPIFTMLSCVKIVWRCVKIGPWPIVPGMKNNGIALKDNGQSTRSRANLHNAQLCEDCVKMCEDWPLTYCARNEEQWYSTEGQWPVNQVKGQSSQCSVVWPLTYCAKNEEQWYSTEEQWPVNQVKGQSSQCSAVWRFALDLLCQEWRTMV